MNDPTYEKAHGESLKKKTIHFLSLLIRPFIDFYYNNGLTRASVLSYILCVNLVVFVYLCLTMGIVVFVAPLQDSGSATRFLELHFLWPMETRCLVQNAPVDFGASSTDLISKEKYEQLLDEYCKRHTTSADKISPETLSYKEFSITQELGSSFHKAVQEFYNRHGELLPGASFFIVLAIAYIALLLNLKTNLAEGVSPLIWGNLPVSNRNSQIMKILWRIPTFKSIKNRLAVFFMLPLLFVLAISILSAGQKFLDRFLEPYTFFNTSLTAMISLIMSAFLFFVLYEINISGISKKNLFIGAFVAACLWLAGRWWFTSYPANSLYRNLRNFAFIPIFLTWFYYFCVVFLFGTFVAQTFQYLNLSNTGRYWIMRDITCMHRYTTLSKWIRSDFLFRLAQNRYEEYPPPFIGVGISGDTADEIAQNAYLPAHFVRECVLEMISHYPQFFYIEVDGNRQYCRLKVPPEEVDVNMLIMDDNRNLLMSEMDNYKWGGFLSEKYGHTWNSPPLPLSEVYQNYKTFQEKNIDNI